jgi:hypothetical protein
MNRSTSTLLKLVLGIVAFSAFAAGPAAAAKKVPVNLRVVTHQGKVLYNGKLKTGTTKIKPNASCLSGSPGPARTLTGPTALGALFTASKQSAALRPLKISDGDFGFGICGVGSAVVRGKNWWVLKYNHADSALGGEVTKPRRNSDVLWYLARSWEETTPDELVLVAPKKARKGKTVKVRVMRSNGKGDRKPVEGAKIRGARTELTDARGFTKVKVTRKTKLSARFAGLIPSNRAVIGIRR